MKKLILFLLFISLVHCTSEPERQAETRQSNGFFEFISSVKMPEHLQWCGEQVPLDIPEVRERAEREFYLLLQRPGQLILYIKRSGRYFPLFERIIKENGMPEDLKYLSVAESALYMSRSSKGAVGLWQFIPSTARHYGLAVNDLVDERRNVEKSTKAAMKYLKQGYKSHKSWMMAAAGYAKYGLNIPDEEQYKPYKTKKVLVEGKVSNIAAWAKKHGTTYKYVKLYNPWILKRSLPKPPNRGVWVVEIPE